ncbi:aspartic peptidase domain-containing protein [Stachybotrys elegans]|uniref:Aspartic peptidase domain-containing protein n=1 Tax=Stachybotrys elegans TaxID=80388 RepID=A0A8K0SN81_9HYPO|nr:aspartic peptidase domain-containing protein [Stachybotrys elegans]
MGVLQLRGLVFGLVAATASAGTVSVPFSRQRQAMTLSKRDGPVSIEALNNMTMGGYFAEFQVGTPPQTVQFQLDTGSSDTWVNTPSTDLCRSDFLQAQMGYCLDTFDPDESSSFESEEDGDFDISYLDGRQISGHYFNDTVTIGGAAIRNQQLGMAVNSVRPTGLMGLGFSSTVAADDMYPTIVDNLYTQGHINSRAFSLYLNEIGSDSGTVLFGGIDSEKYIGDLAFLPLATDLGTGNSSEIQIWAVGIDGIRWLVDDEERGTGADNGSYALLDSGATISLLPTAFADSVMRHYDVRKIELLNMGLVDCRWGGEEGRGQGHEFDFVFDGKTIRVPMSEMVINAFSEEQLEVFDSSFAPSDLRRAYQDFEGRICLFGIESIADYGIEDDALMILGDTFLRSAYVVYDMENLELAIAQANVNQDRSNVIEIPANSTRIPRVSGVDEQTGGARNNGDGNDDDDDESGSPQSMLPSLSLGLFALISMALAL